LASSMKIWIEITNVGLLYHRKIFTSKRSIILKTIQGKNKVGIFPSPGGEFFKKDYDEEK
jgi:hypothetical protein